ncbi:MAG: glycosyl hydrolase family 28-related protein [Phycisphaerae bacterium]
MRLVDADATGNYDASPAINAILQHAVSNDPVVYIPAGTYRLDSPILVQGRGVTLRGDGVRTLLRQNFSFHGGTTTGQCVQVMPTFGESIPLAEPVQTTNFATVSASTVLKVARKPLAPFFVGEWLFLNNGKGGTQVLETALGGVLKAQEFFQYAPCEYVRIKSIDVTGQLLTLETPVFDYGDYSTIGAADTTDASALNVWRVSTPCEFCAVKDLAFATTDQFAAATIFVCSALRPTISGITILDYPANNQGGIGIVQSTGPVVRGVYSRSPAGIGFNSSRYGIAAENTVNEIGFEEACTDCHVDDNIIMPTTNGIGVRIGDKACRRIMIRGNTVLGAAHDYGAIGVWEGTNIMVDGNILAGPNGNVWGQLNSGNNIADAPE